LHVSLGLLLGLSRLLGSLALLAADLLLTAATLLVAGLELGDLLLGGLLHPPHRETDLLLFLLDPQDAGAHEVADLVEVFELGAGRNLDLADVSEALEAV